MLRCLAVLVGLLLVYGCDSGGPGPSTVATPTTLATTVSVTPTTATLETPIVISGTGTLNSSPIQLTGGTYIADGKTSEPNAPCLIAGYLMPVEQSSGIPPQSLPLDGPKTGETSSSRTTYLYNVEPGQYFVSVTSGCSDWSVTFRRP